MLKKTSCAIIISAVMVISSTAIAHPGRTDDFGGHMNKETGEYHCHKTTKICEIVYKLQNSVKELESSLKSSKAKSKRLQQDLHTAEDKIVELTSKVRESFRQASVEASNAQHAEIRAMNAEQDMRDAELRAEGHGPAVSSRCKRTLTPVLARKPHWLTGNVNLNEKDRNAVRFACELGPSL